MAMAGKSWLGKPWENHGKEIPELSLEVSKMGKTNL
jgi:hypothetical protein